jgi:hypothetical protein
MDRKKLTLLFRKAGAREPEAWAASQLEEGIPQLARFLFLRQAWRAIVDENDKGWIAKAIGDSESYPLEPYAGVGHALQSLRARGATDEELTDLVRGTQAELLFRICYLLEDPGDVEPEFSDVAWALVQVDGDGSIIGSIGGLHESVLETDPTGREMRPRGASNNAPAAKDDRITAALTELKALAAPLKSKARGARRARPKSK